MSLTGDLVYWLRGELVGETAYSDDGTRAAIAADAQIDYAPVSRKPAPDRVSIGVSSPPGVQPLDRFGGDREHTATITVVAKTERGLESVEPAIRKLEAGGALVSVSGTLDGTTITREVRALDFSPGAGYVRTPIMLIKLDTGSLTQDPDEGLVAHAYTFSVETRTLPT